MLWQWRKMQNLKRNWLFQNWHEEFNKLWSEYSKISKICTLMSCFWPQYIMLKLRKCRGVMFDNTEYLKENWPFLSKVTWGIWEVFTRALESLKIGTLMGFFYPKYKMYQLKIYREVICQDKEKRCKIWRWIDLSFQNWYEDFDGFWPEHSKI